MRSKRLCVLQEANDADNHESDATDADGVETFAEQHQAKFLFVMTPQKT